MPATPTHLFDKTLNVQRRTTSQDSGGSPTVSYSAHLTGIKARIQPMDEDEAIRYGGSRNRRMWRIFVAASNDVTATDRIQYTDTDSVTHTIDITGQTNPQENGCIKKLIGQETQQ